MYPFRNCVKTVSHFITRFLIKIPIIIFWSFETDSAFINLFAKQEIDESVHVMKNETLNAIRNRLGQN